MAAVHARCAAKFPVHSSRTVVDLFENAVAGAPDKVILRCKVAGRWQTTTLEQWRDISARWALGLIALGLEPGQRVAIAATTRREWMFADMAIVLAGGVTVPIYPSALADDVAWLAGHAAIRFAFVESHDQVAKLAGHRAALPQLQTVIVWDDQPGAAAQGPGLPGSALDWLIRSADLERLGDATPATVLADRRGGIDAGDPCTIVYTSGTTGRPKGAVLSHGAFVFEALACSTALDVRPDDCLFLFLPLAHSFAKMVYVVCMALRTEMAIPASMETLIADLAEAAPTVMPSVPRVFEKVHTKIMAGVQAAGPVRQNVFALALRIGKRVAKLQLDGRQPDALLRAQHELAQRLVFRKIAAVFGGRIRGFISGGAPLSPELAEFFFAVGLPIFEGYGMTENCAAATVNKPGACKIGTVGRPITGVEISVADDGEVLIRGANLMLGYLDNPEATALALDSEGWLHTGDVGEIDSDGYLRITDRKKDIIITAGGKNIAPQNIEAHFKNCPFISNCMVYGDKRKFLSMLVTLDEYAVTQWADQQGVRSTSFAELAQKPEMYRLLQEHVDARNRGLASYETIKKFAILDRDFSIEEGEITPSMKLRRREVTHKHQGLLDSFYTEHY